MTADNSPLDVVQLGKGRNLVLLHWLLSDRTALRSHRAPSGRRATRLAGQSAGIRRFGAGRTRT